MKRLATLAVLAVLGLSLTACEPPSCPVGQTYSTQWEFGFGYWNGKYQYAYQPISKCR